MTPTTIVAHLLLFFAVGALFLLVSLTVGWLLRPHSPNAEKLEVYECGEPTIGSSFVQFDLRFYVVALLFIIFDVEVAFFFPWATVFGKATQLADPGFEKVVAGAGLTEPAEALLHEMGVANPAAQVPIDAARLGELASTLARISFADILVFFAVLLVGFAYVWKRGDIDWVRAVSRQRTDEGPRPEDAQPQRKDQPAVTA